MPPVEVLVPLVLAADEKESEGEAMTCAVCGKEFESSIKHKTCCSPECRAVYKRQYRRDLEQRKRMERETKGETQNRFCKGCRYGIRLGFIWGCDYIGQTGHRRPCPSALAVGRRCDVFEPAKGKKSAYIPSFERRG